MSDVCLCDESLAALSLCVNTQSKEEEEERFIHPVQAKPGKISSCKDQIKSIHRLSLFSQYFIDKRM